MSRAEYMRAWRLRRYGGTDPHTKARNRANAAAAQWVRDTFPAVWRQLYTEARAEFGLPPLSADSPSAEAQSVERGGPAPAALPTAQGGDT